MLGKLIKYEIKATGRIFLPLFLALLTIAGITKILSAFSPEKLDTQAIISMVIYIVILAGMCVMALIMMIQRFYKNLLSDEGYLMFTLPVKPWKHIVSKLLVSMMWIVVSGITALISILIIALKKGSITEIIKELIVLYHQVINQFGPSAYLLAFETIIGIFISLASGILIVYASIAIGNLFSQHKILASFGAFIILNTLSNIVLIIFGSIPKIASITYIHDSSPSFIGIMQVVLLIGIIFNGLICAAYFAITNHILSKRLNLE